jgi:muramoyltetrapeptide carboxypeptidase
MSPIVPRALDPGDKVAVVAPAGPVDGRALDLGCTWLRQRHLPVLREDIGARVGYFAGDDHRRLTELQEALDDPSIRGIIAARGGYGVTTLIDRLDFDKCIESPKWIVGSSDLTALLIHLFAAHRYLTLHGPMVEGFHRTEERDVTALGNLLEGQPWIPADPLEGLSSGAVRGPFIGGNLTVLAHLAGTIRPAFADGVILFLEDVGERPYRLDRCMTQLERAGILERVSGIVLGELTACDPGPDGVSARAALERHLAPLKIPVAAGYPAAHGVRNAPFVHGEEMVLEVSGESACICPLEHPLPERSG